MQTAVAIEDWTPGAEREPRPDLRLVSETVTAGELVAQRVAEECARLEAARAGEAESVARSCLVVPGAVEAALNGDGRVFGPGAPRKQAVERQVEIARRAFAKGRFVLLFNGAQVVDWEQRLVVGENSRATFIKLIPLRGG